jgi:hypothetical protein
MILTKHRDRLGKHWSWPARTSDFDRAFAASRLYNQLTLWFSGTKLPPAGGVAPFEVFSVTYAPVRRGYTKPNWETREPKWGVWVRAVPRVLAAVVRERMPAALGGAAAWLETARAQTWLEDRHEARAVFHPGSLMLVIEEE